MKLLFLTLVLSFLFSALVSRAALLPRDPLGQARRARRVARLTLDIIRKADNAAIWETAQYDAMSRDTREAAKKLFIESKMVNSLRWQMVQLFGVPELTAPARILQEVTNALTTMNQDDFMVIATATIKAGLTPAQNDILRYIFYGNLNTEDYQTLEDPFGKLAEVNQRMFISEIMRLNFTGKQSASVWKAFNRLHSREVCSFRPEEQRAFWGLTDEMQMTLLKIYIVGLTDIVEGRKANRVAIAHHEAENQVRKEETSSKSGPRAS